MATIKSKYDEVRVPFTKMSFCPDVPSTQLGPNEYNKGINVECDVRGIRSVAGDEEILSTVPGTPTYVSSGFRRSGEFWFIVATTEGNWYASNGGAWQNITPGTTPFSGYTQATNITEAWNGTVPFFNDSLNPPMFLPDEDNAKLVPYSNTLPKDISEIVVNLDGTCTILLNGAYDVAPYVVGEQIVISGVDQYFNGTFVVVSSTTTTITYTDEPGAAYPGGGSVAPLYAWNYTPNWRGYYANFMRLYSTPNVGSILVAGNLSVTTLSSTTVDEIFPVTIQWSQNFGLNQAPKSWEPTVTNIANQLEVPLRGPALDGFPCNGNFFLCSYWDTVVFSPLNYSTTSAPILGVRLYNQGRGLLSSNCWANTDKLVYGVDARDIWVFDGTDFQGLGNQQVKNWFFDQMDPQYYDRVFMEVNSQKNQVEIYYPDSEAINGVPNRMLSYRYDLQIWNAPREVDSATMACESPIYTGTTPNLGSRTVVYARGKTNQKLVQKDQSYSWANSAPITSSFRRDNIKLLKDYSGKLMVHRILPEAVNMGATPFSSYNNLPLDPADSAQSSHKGNVTVTVYGANSVGSSPSSTIPVTMPIDANGNTIQQSPWCQIDQNAYRVNSIELSNTSNSSIWMCSATTWQVTQVEDDR
jgi:hypothetical protein